MIWIDKKKRPNVVILDQSPALIGASVKAFTSYKSTEDYVTDSFNKLEEKICTPEDTFLRLDVSHLIKILYNLSCFKNVDERVKTFYFRCFLLIRTIENYETLKEIVCETRSAKSKSRLKTLLVNMDESQTDKNYEKPEVTNGDEDSKVSKTDTDIKEFSHIPSWFTLQIDKENLLISLTDDDDMSSHENLYFMPSLIPHLSRLIAQLPLWSNIMVPIYGSTIRSPSSSNVESSFKTLKRYLFKMSTKSNRLRVDKFIIKHSEFISVELKTAIAKEEC